MENENFDKKSVSDSFLNKTRPPPGTKLRSTLDLVYRKNYDGWLRSFHLRPSWESHSDLVDPYIWHGYRPNPTSLKYCLKSAFYPTNEALNMWTHLIPGLIVLWKTYSVYGLLENPAESIAYPLWIYSFGCCFVFFSSAAAHLLNCYSITAQELCFCLDYGSIAVFGLTLAVSFQHLTCPVECMGINEDFFPVSYTSLVFLLMLFSLHLTCCSRYPDCSKRYLYRFGPYAASYCVAGFPCFMRYLSSEHPDVVTLTGFHPVTSERCYLGEEYSSNYFSHLACLSTAMIFIFTRFPECLFPGRFDIIGHSHQWFHVCVAYGMYMQHVITTDALMDALHIRHKSQDKASFDFNVKSNFTSLVVLVLLMLFMCVRSSRKTSRLLKLIRATND